MPAAFETYDTPTKETLKLIRDLYSLTVTTNTLLEPTSLACFSKEKQRLQVCLNSKISYLLQHLRLHVIMLWFQGREEV